MKIIGASTSGTQPDKETPAIAGDSTEAKREETNRTIIPPVERYPKTPAIELKAIPIPSESPALDSDKKEMLGELKNLQEKFEQVRSRLTEQLLNNTRQVAKLSEEISELKEVLANLPMIKAHEASISVPQAPAILPTARQESSPVPDVKLSLAADDHKPDLTKADANDPVEQPNKFLDAISPAAINSEPHERKVAFISKLWDYLNHVAFEIPLHKTNRSN